MGCGGQQQRPKVGGDATVREDVESPCIVRRLMIMQGYRGVAQAGPRTVLTPFQIGKEIEATQFAEQPRRGGSGEAQGHDSVGQIAGDHTRRVDRRLHLEQ